MTKLNKNNKGFTLIELLVVIAIIAILAIVGLVLFNGQQASARDSRRRADIDAMVQALEGTYVPNSGTYTGITFTMFANNVIPTDVCGQNYIEKSSAASNAILPNVDPVAAPWAACTANPAGWTTISAAAPVNNSKAWTLCAHLETSNTVYCRSNSR